MKLKIISFVGRGGQGWKRAMMRRMLPMCAVASGKMVSFVMHPAGMRTNQNIDEA